MNGGRICCNNLMCVSIGYVQHSFNIHKALAGLQSLDTGAPNELLDV